MAKVPQTYKVTVSYNPEPDLDKLTRGYTIMIKIAIRMIEEKKHVTAG